MKNTMDPQMSAIQAQLSSSAVQKSLPKLEDLPEARQQELIQALASLLMHDPALQALLEVRHERRS
jgi:hypothetical protein